MKKIILFLLTAVLAVSLCAVAIGAVEVKMTIGEAVGYVDGEAKELDAAPIIRGNRTMLPVRFVAESLGATVEWDGVTSTATITSSTVEIKITIGAEYAVVNNEAVKLDVPAFIENDRTYMPVRFVAETLGATVAWDGATSTATITLDEYTPFPVATYTPVHTGEFNYLALNCDEYITLGQYTGLALSIADFVPAPVTDEQVAEYIEELLAENPLRVQIINRPAIFGDNIVIDYTGKIDGVAFAGGSATDVELVLGDGAYIPGFEDGIVGMKVDETRDIEVTFPVNYQNTELAGKKAIFTIVLKSIYEEQPAEYTDAYVKEMFGCETTAEFEASVKAELEAEYENEITAAKTDVAFWEAVANATVIKFPEGLIEDLVYQQLIYVYDLATTYGVDYETLLTLSGYTVKDYETAVFELTEETVRKQLVLAAIANKENLIATEEDVTAEIMALGELYGFSYEQIISLLSVDEEALRASAKAYISQNKVYAFLIANNSFSF